MGPGPEPSLADLPGTPVLMVGDVMLDEYIWGRVDRISPEAPVPIVEVERRTYVPGGAANTAAGVAALGGRVWLGGAVGDDQPAERLRGVLDERGVDHGGLVVDRERETTTKTRILANNQQVVRADVEHRRPLDPHAEDQLIDWVTHRVEDVAAVVLSDYAKGVVSTKLARDVIALATGAGKLVIVDPKGPDFTKYAGATLITPNLQEAERAGHTHVQSYEDLTALGRRLSELLDGCALLVTLGAQGMSLFRDGQERLDVPAAARDVFDITGAGDTVVSTVAVALGAGIALEAAVRLASAAAGLAVAKVGTATVTMDELLSEGG